MSNTFDVIVIGAGPGGYPAAIRCAQLGLKTACIEKEKLGGVCLNWGCVPSKALLKSAELVHKIRDAKAFGILVDKPQIDFPAVIKRSRKVSKRFEKGVKGLFKKYGVTSISGTASIPEAGTVVVGEDTYNAAHIIIATGARAKTFPSIEPDGERILTYREAIVSNELPSSVTVLGAGAIGLEFAYFWHAMGVEVTVVEGLDEILPHEDREISGVLRKVMTKSGIGFELGRFAKSVTRDGDGTLTILQDGTEIRADRTLVALGVSPNSSIATDIDAKLEGGFIAIDGDCRTSVPGVYALGDVSTKGGLAHIATAQAHMCAERLAGHTSPDVRYDAIPSCTYCQPQVASVGLTEEQAKERGKSYKVGRFPFRANGKAQGAGHPEGLVKVLIDDQYGEILGAHIVGSEATEMIAEFTLAITSESTADVLLNTIHAHPTHSEVMFEAVAQALGVSVHM